VIFTASAGYYANAIVNYLDPNREFITAVLNRDSCLETKNGFFIKDLRVIGNRDLKNLIIVDNLSHSFGLQISNGVPIVEWRGAKDDQELRYLAEYLIEASTQSDLRKFNEERLRLHQLAEMPWEELSENYFKNN
jgi:CTD small phosphatase-like protein 2